VLENWLRSIVDFFDPGDLVLGIVFLIAAPFVDQLLIRRKRITYRVLYNSKIGLVQESLDDGGERSEMHPSLRQLAHVLERMSIVVIRIRNTGSYDINPSDFDKPIEFTFGRRIVWNARVSEAPSDAARERLRSSLRFINDDAPAAHNPPARDTLTTLRGRLGQVMARLVGPSTAPQQGADQPRWHGVRLDGLSLRRGQKFKLVVVLREPDDHRDADGGSGGSTKNVQITKDIDIAGDLRDAGVIKDEKRQRRITLPRVTGVLAAVLTLLLLVSLVYRPSPADPSLACASGDLTIEGSTVFVPTLDPIVDDYMRACGGARLTATAIGSIDGVRKLAGLDPVQAAGFLASSDGRHNEQGVGYSAQVAIVLYHVVVNGSVGLDNLTTAQLRGIYDGTYQDWSQLRGGPSLPIRIIGRGQESGTRELFENSVLHLAEPGLSSNECTDKDRDPAARVIRCERGSNEEVVRAISQISGAIGYADAPSVTQARKSNALNAVTLDNKVFDAAAGVDSDYPFWTVEYFYAKTEPVRDSLAANFIQYVQTHNDARARLTDAGYLPCVNAAGIPLDLCNRR